MARRPPRANPLPSARRAVDKAAPHASAPSSSTRPWPSVAKPGNRALNSRVGIRCSTIRGVSTSPRMSGGMPGRQGVSRLVTARSRSRSVRPVNRNRTRTPANARPMRSPHRQLPATSPSYQPRTSEGKQWRLRAIYDGIDEDGILATASQADPAWPRFREFPNALFLARNGTVSAAICLHSCWPSARSLWWAPCAPNRCEVLAKRSSCWPLPQPRPAPTTLTCPTRVADPSAWISGPTASIAVPLTLPCGTHTFRRIRFSPP